MVRKHLAVASALVLLMAVAAQADVRVRIVNDANYKYLKNMGGVLKGAVFEKDLHLNVTGGTTTLGTASSGGTTSNTVTAGSVSGTDVLTLPISLSLNSYAERLSGGLLIPNSAGGSITLFYRADVGIANRITRRSTSVIDFNWFMALSAPISSGATIGGTPVDSTHLASSSLSSKVKERGTLADPGPAGHPRDGAVLDQLANVGNTNNGVIPVTFRQNPKTLKWAAARPRTNLRNLYGVVGSEATIVDSTALPTDSTVSMEWRARTPAEAHKPAPSSRPVNDLDLSDTSGRWLTSDVVKIDGISGGTSTVYAMQMTFDNRINWALESPDPLHPTTYASVTTEHDALRIAQFNTGTGKWVEQPALGNNETAPDTHLSLAAFLTEKITNEHLSLSDLVGSWGVDDSTYDSVTHPFGVSDKGKGYSWAIVQGGGSGIFAVVPEPGTLALLISAGLGLAVFGVRRMRKTVA